MANNAPLIFLHIPKTGGSTLHNIIHNQYKKKELITLYKKDMHQLYEMPAEQRKRIKVLLGHFPFGHHVAFEQPEQVRYFTLLRYPVDRIISLYYFILTRPHHPYYKTITQNNYTLADFAHTMRIPQADNAQVRMLANAVDLPFGACTEATLQQAKENLDQHFAVAATLKHYDRFLMMCQLEFGWNMMYYAKANVSTTRKPKSAISAEVLGKIAAQNQLDTELCRYADQRFEEQWEQNKQVLEKNLARFLVRNPKAAKLIRLKRKFF